MKRVICLMLILSFALGMTACGCKHVWQEADCNQPKICEICSEVQGEALGHDWKEATCTEAKSCSRCGETVGEPLGHEKESVILKEPTSFNEPGEKAIKCSRCGEILETNPLKMKPSVDGDHFNFTPEEFLDYLDTFGNVFYHFEFSKDSTPVFEALVTDYSESLSFMTSLGINSIGGIPISQFYGSPMPFERDKLTGIDNQLAVHLNNSGDDYADAAAIAFHCNDSGKADAIIIVGISELTLLNMMGVHSNVHTIGKLFVDADIPDSATLSKQMQNSLLNLDNAPLGKTSCGSIDISFDMLVSNVNVYKSVMSSADINRMLGCYSFAVITPAGVSLF